MIKHTMLDCYGANQNQLNDMMGINDLLNKLVFNLKLNPVCPPQLIPYYYGKVKEDIGISAFILLEGGHITIHTFPLRECYFVDVYTPTDLDVKGVHDFLMKELPFDDSKSFQNTKERTLDVNEELPYDPQVDFGPHLMMKIKPTLTPSMEDFFDFLENIVAKINMDPITRPYVIKSSPKKAKYLSALIVIAQSHISLHYDYKQKVIMADIFSCAPFDYSEVSNLYAPLGKVESLQITARGTKHIYKVKSSINKDTLKASTRWQKAIKNK
jgi:S-adenosylmethionine/arginine decarboxylase-like enzyme